MYLSTSTTAATSTFLFIDASVQDASVLAANTKPGISIHILDTHQDGIQQITRILQNSEFQISPSEALCERNFAFQINIVAHGSPGTLYLGNSELSLTTLDRYTQDLKSWFTPSSQLPDSATPQLHFYACNVAAGDAGAEFLTKLHQLTGANIAASTTPIGNAAKGGNWILDAIRGDRVVAEIISPEAQAAYSGILADPTITDNASLDREAEEETAFSITDLAIADADNDNLTVTVTVASDAESPTGTLDFGGSTDTTHTFSGTAAEVTASLNSLQYTGRENFSGDATIQISVDDGSTSVSQAITIAVADINDDPTINPVALTVDEGGSANFADANFNIEDVDNDDIQIIVKVTQLPSQGTLRLGSNRLVPGSTFDYTQIANLSYEHDGSQVTNPSGAAITDFQVTVEDGAGGIITNAVIPITVMPVNQAPSVSGSATLFEGAEDQVVSLSISDVDQSAPFNVEILSLPDDGDGNDDDGVLKLNGVEVQIGDIISAADFDAGLVTYTHDG
ncbi:MAG: DUF4347 domain-containing protein, partial [Cyanothece sp. SIO2G6]|nr:DUF4347 domain-containing protein [Cyanothece sp. SIO2G6]